MAAEFHPMKMIVGCIVALAALAVAYQSWNDAHFAYLRVSDPKTAYADRPTDALALGKVLDQKIKTQPDAPISAADESLIDKALAEAPLSRVLLRIIGIRAEFASNVRHADAAFALSNAISRRDALTQLGLIERSVQKDDLRGAVRHYHAALSVHPELSPALIPILTKAIAFPEVRGALSPYIANNTLWTKDLLNIAAEKGKPVDVAQLILRAGVAVRGDAYAKINANLITRLAEEGNFPMASKVAKAIVPGTDLRALALLAVQDTTIDRRLGLLAWDFTDGRILASPNGQHGFDIDVDPLVGGPVATRIVPVAGGRKYIFSQILRGDADARASLAWQAICVPSDPQQVFWQQTLPPAAAAGKLYEIPVTVPASCRGLKLVLSARGPEGQQPAHVALEALDLKPVLD